MMLNRYTFISFPKAFCASFITLFICYSPLCAQQRYEGDLKVIYDPKDPNSKFPVKIHDIIRNLPKHDSITYLEVLIAAGDDCSETRHSDTLGVCVKDFLRRTKEPVYSVYSTTHDMFSIRDIFYYQDGIKKALPEIYLVIDSAHRLCIKPNLKVW
jgi:hypothetical protein